MAEEKLDGELLADSSEEAFAELIRRHGTMVFDVCRRVVGQQDAEDAMQAVFLTLAMKRASLVGVSSLAAWLHRVSWCVARDLRQAAASRKAREQKTVAVPTPTFQPQVEWQEIESLLDEELSALPERYRQPILLHLLEGQSIEGAAQRLKWNTGTFASRLSRGKELLRRRLERRGIVVSATALSQRLIGHAEAADLPTALAATTSKLAAQAVTHSPETLCTASVIGLAKGVIAMLFWTKVKIVVLGAAAVLLCVGGLALLGRQIQRDAPARQHTPRNYGRVLEKQGNLEKREYDLADINKASNNQFVIGLTDLVRTHISPEAWDITAGCYAEAQAEKLTVVQLPAIHETLEEFFRASHEYYNRISAAEKKFGAQRVFPSNLVPSPVLLASAQNIQVAFVYTRDLARLYPELATDLRTKWFADNFRSPKTSIEEATGGLCIVQYPDTLQRIFSKLNELRAVHGGPPQNAAAH